MPKKVATEKRKREEGKNEKAVKAVKKGPTGFMMFKEEKSKELMEKKYYQKKNSKGEAGFNHKRIAKTLGKMWAELTKDEKDSYAKKWEAKPKKADK